MYGFNSSDVTNVLYFYSTVIVGGFTILSSSWFVLHVVTWDQRRPLTRSCFQESALRCYKFTERLWFVMSNTSRCFEAILKKPTLLDLGWLLVHEVVFIWSLAGHFLIPSFLSLLYKGQHFVSPPSLIWGNYFIPLVQLSKDCVKQYRSDWIYMM